MPRHPRTTSAFDQALRLIHQRACDGSTIEQILDTLPISRQTLERHFVTHLGRTPSQELVRVRLEQAKTLLIMTRHPIKRVAMMVGFRQAANFSIFFRNQTGLSPSTFRQTSQTLNHSDGPVRHNSHSADPQSRPIKFESRANVASALVF